VSHREDCHTGIEWGRHVLYERDLAGEGGATQPGELGMRVEIGERSYVCGGGEVPKVVLAQRELREWFGPG